MASGISRANARQVQLISDFNRFPVFGLAHKHIMEFGVDKATLWCEFMEERLFHSLLVWSVVTLTFRCFSNMIFDWLTHLFMKRLVWLGHFNFSSEFSEFEFWTILDCHLIVLQYGFGIAHRYASNVKPSSEAQKYLFWCEFAKPRFSRMFFGFRHCKITIQVLTIAVFGLAGFQ